MNDKELLELAAKAAGVAGKYNSAAEEFYLSSKTIHPSGATNIAWWNPLTDDGDALRLAVKLKMNIHNSAHSPDGIAFVYAQVKGHSPQQEYNLDDHCAATRRAIVRAAAEIGKLLR